MRTDCRLFQPCQKCSSNSGSMADFPGCVYNHGSWAAAHTVATYKKIEQFIENESCKSITMSLINVFISINTDFKDGF